jgi:hypothetical protein
VIQRYRRQRLVRELGHGKRITIIGKSAFLSFVCLLLTVTYATSVAAASPEIYWSEMDYTNRVLIVKGAGLIGGTAGSPSLPAVSVGGRTVAIDGTASVGATNFSTGEGSLIVPFNAIVSALPEAVQTTPSGNQIPGDSNFALTVTTTDSVVLRASLYFPQAVQEVLPPPPPPTGGTCPCSADYANYYQEVMALIWPTCTAPQSSNKPASGSVPVDQYIEASYIDEIYVYTRAIGSDSSTSPRASLRNTCQVRHGNYWPIEPSAAVDVQRPVSDADHQACVAEIMALEAICRGGNWLDP